ncbi:hypothetical protein [Hoeflea sp.]|uniref:hypothetical protein n=1 Tax=Hoeflea sp. TaxID=1940281 RepID=UPI003A8FA7AD
MSRTKVTAMIVALTLCGCVAQSPQNTGGRKPSVNLDAVLPPQSLLREDTLAALTHDRSQSRLAYVGVWATDGDKCAMMDQTAFEGFAVITPNSIRRSAETCTFEPGEPGSDVARLDATCKARGRKTTKRTISLQMLSSRSLYLSTAPDRPGVAMVRCRLLQ